MWHPISQLEELSQVFLNFVKKCRALFRAFGFIVAYTIFRQLSISRNISWPDLRNHWEGEEMALTCILDILIPF